MGDDILPSAHSDDDDINTNNNYTTTITASKSTSSILAVFVASLWRYIIWRKASMKLKNIWHADINARTWSRAKAFVWSA